jgi:hypothetical protein
MNQSDWKKEVDQFLAKTVQPKKLPQTSNVSRQPMPLLSLRPRYVPPMQQRMIAYRPPPPPPLMGQQRMRPAPVVSHIRYAASSVSTFVKPIEAVPSKIIENKISVPPLVHQPLPTNTTDVDDENQLLELDEPTDVVDTFALIDEALIEADNLLELM